MRPVQIAWHLYVQPWWGTISVADVRHSEVQAWVSEISKNHGASTVIRGYGVPAVILDIAVRDRRILSNPARGANLPRKVRKEHFYLSHEQVHARARASEDHRTLVLLLAYNGLHWGEAIGLRVKDVDLKSRRITVSVNAVEVGRDIDVGTPKSHKRRTVPFPRLFADGFKTKCSGKSPDDPIFADS